MSDKSSLFYRFVQAAGELLGRGFQGMCTGRDAYCNVDDRNRSPMVEAPGESQSDRKLGALRPD
jgi:hypothetical protein